MSVHRSLVVTCWERADPLTVDLLCFVTFPSELRAMLGRRESGLSPPVKYFTDRSKAVLLLRIIYVISVLFCHVFVCFCSLMPCGHLMENG